MKTILGLSKNKITSFARKLPDSIKRVDLSGNLIEYFPDIFTQSIESIDLINNRIEEIPDFIRDLKKLRRLEIGRNKLKRISPDICSLKYLEVFGFDQDNRALKILEVPECMGEMYSLNLTRKDHERLKLKGRVIDE